MYKSSERAILHIDINSCYAQIEEMLIPALKCIPMAVGGHEEDRHGIILAKNNIAKKYNIKTGETLREASKKCVDLLIIHPHYDTYMYYTSKVKDIYREYTNCVESFGLDEAWLDVSASKIFGSPFAIAKEIQQRVWDEIGLTVSVGVSYNKIFAKLASDMIKPSGLVQIHKENIEDIVWPLPVEDLLYVGRATQKKLNSWGVYTIGELAKMDLQSIRKKLGKMGEIIWGFANGLDTSDVALSEHFVQIKSCGNSITTCRDITTREDAKLIFFVLAESVASRLKESGLKGNALSISIRDIKLKSFTRQKKLDQATNICEIMMQSIMELLNNNCEFDIPLRSIGVSVSQLVPDLPDIQLSLFEDTLKQNNSKRVDTVMDEIRGKFGYNSIKRCALLIDKELTDFNPKGDHTIHPVGYF